MGVGRVSGVWSRTDPHEATSRPRMIDAYELEQALRSENRTNPITDRFLKMMTPLITIVEIEREESKISVMQKAELRRHILTIQRANSISIPTLLAAAGRVVELELGYSLRTVQLIAVLSFCDTDTALRGRLGQVLTGEGKTLIIALLALKLAVIDGRKVDVITSNKSLAERDAKQFQRLASWFQVSVGHVTDKRDPEVYSSQVIYSHCHQVQHDMLSYDLQQQGGRSGRPFDVVLADEVDNLFIDRLLHGSRIASSLPGGELLIPIWLEVFFLVEEEWKNDEVFEHVKRRIEMMEWPLSQDLRTLAKKNLRTWIVNAREAAEERERDCDYIVEDGQVIIVDSDHTGQVMHGVHWSDGLTQMVQIKERLPVSSESLALAYVSNLSFFRRYKTVYGLTGTLGTEAESKALQQLYKVDSWKIPPHKPKNFKFFGGLVVPTHGKWFDGVLESVRKAKADSRAVLVVCEYISDAQNHKALLQQHTCQNVIMYTRDDNAENEAPEQELKAGDVVVATNIGGRGTDFKVSQVVNAAGGLHVILTYLPLNSRVEDQAFGRTARGGSPGSGEIIVWNKRCASFGLLKLVRDAKFEQHVARLFQLVGPEERRSKLFQDYAALTLNLRSRVQYLQAQKGNLELELAWCEAARLDTQHSWQLIFGDKLDDSEQSLAALEGRWRDFFQIDSKASQAPFHHPSSLVFIANHLSSGGRRDIAEKLYTRALAFDDPQNLAIAAALMARFANSILANPASAGEDLSRAASVIEYHWDNWVKAYAHVVALGSSHAEGSSSDDSNKGNYRLGDRIMQRVEVLEWFKVTLDKAQKDLNSWSRWSSPTVVFDRLPMHIDSAIQEEFKSVGLNGLLRITDFWNRWGPWIVIVLGFLEIFAAALVAKPGLALALAQHGVDDVICGVKGAWHGNFDMESYAYQKCLKVFLTTCTTALNAIVEPNAEEAAAWTKNRLQALGQKVARDIVVEVKAAALDELLATVTPHCIEEWVLKLQTKFSSKNCVGEKLQTLARSDPEFMQQLGCLLLAGDTKEVFLRHAKFSLEAGKGFTQAPGVDPGWEGFQIAGLRFCLFQFASKDLKFDKGAKRWRDKKTNRFSQDPVTLVEKWAPRAEILADASKLFMESITRPSEDVVVQNFEEVRADVQKEFREAESRQSEMSEALRRLDRLDPEGDKRRALVNKCLEEWGELLNSHMKAEIRSSVLKAVQILTPLASSKVVCRVRETAYKLLQKKRKKKSKKKQPEGGSKTT